MLTHVSAQGRFAQADTLIPGAGDSQAWDRYAFALNNPVRYGDPSGHWVETAFDVAMILVDVSDIAENGLTWGNGAALAVDIASAAIPGIPAMQGNRISEVLAQSLALAGLPAG